MIVISVFISCINQNNEPLKIEKTIKLEQFIPNFRYKNNT